MNMTNTVKYDDMHLFPVFVSPGEGGPRSPAAAICRRSLGNNPFPIERGCQGSRPPQAARAKRAPLTAPFNRNFRLQEIDGKWRRPLRFEPAAGDAPATKAGADGRIGEFVPHHRNA